MQMILPPRRHLKKNSLTELYSIYMQAPNNFRSHSHMPAPQLLPNSELLVGLATAGISAARNSTDQGPLGHQSSIGGTYHMGGNLAQSSIVEVSEASDS